jgi:hypothetical protein
MAGSNWVNGFLKRHPTLSVRVPERTSPAKARGFNRVVVGDFFILLKSLLDKYNFLPVFYLYYLYIIFNKI